MKWLAAALVVVVALLQYRLWLSEDGVRELARLDRAVTAQKTENERLAERNRQLAAEVRDLKKGLAALEERARSELGMVAANETFYQVVMPHERVGFSAPTSVHSVPADAPAETGDVHGAPTRTAAR